MKNLKKIVSILVVMTFLSTSLFAQAAYEAQRESENINVKLAVMQGPTGFGAAGLLKNEGKINDKVTVETRVYGSPTEVIAKIANGEEDIAALPSNLASVLFNKGLKIKLAAVTGNGMLSVVSSSATSIEDLIGTSISIPGGPAATPNQLAQYLIESNNLSATDFTLEYGVTSAAQLSQLLIAGKVKSALLPEPFTTMVLARNKDVKVVLNAQEAYKMASGKDNYPMTVLVVQESFANEHPQELKQVLNAFKDSIAFVNSNPEQAGTLIEGIGIMKAAMATPAIPNCNLTYVSSQDAKEEILGYYNVLFNFNPASIGGKLPTDALFL